LSFVLRKNAPGGERELGSFSRVCSLVLWFLKKEETRSDEREGNNQLVDVPGIGDYPREFCSRKDVVTLLSRSGFRETQQHV
jgi:hypothetical protein